MVLRDKPRHEFVLTTKVGRLIRDGAPVFDFSYDGVMRSVEESLGRLGMDRVDVLLIHDPDDHYDEALRGAYPALDRLRSEGVISALGAGMNQAEMPARFARAADFDCFLLAGRFTLLDRIGARDLLPLCLERGIAVVAGGAYNSGILADPEGNAHYNYRPAPPELIRRALALKATCEEHGVALKAAALQFPLRHAAIPAVLTGCSSVAELEENLRMFQAPIPDDLWAELDA